jgi:hypothetical protein
MKLQYLGDSKDSFKWDYHDYLISALGFPTLTVVLMLTADDSSNDGGTHPELFPARRSVVDLCRVLREQRNVELIRSLPLVTGSNYSVELHNGPMHLTNRNREQYFSGFSAEENQVVFLDPDNGFEPHKSRSEKHVLYADVDSVLKETSDATVISVFQHSRRLPFQTDYGRIRERILTGHSTALYWRSLMFVAIARTREAIERVEAINRQYAESHPVRLLTSAGCACHRSHNTKEGTLFEP